MLRGSFAPWMLFFMAASCLFLTGCDYGDTSEGDDTRRTKTLREEVGPIHYSEHLSCTLRDEVIHWQHMYRLSLDGLVGEFVGGQGGSIKTLQSTEMQVSPSHVAITFAAESKPQQGELEIRPFRVHIHRRTLAYQWSWAPADKASEPAVPQFFGKCVLLDAESF
jgi:hypothetical protein